MPRHLLKFGALAALASIALPAAASAQSVEPLEAGDTLLRVRGIVIAPQGENGDILPAFPGETVSVSNTVVPEVDITYMVTDTVGFELIAATSPHDISGKTGTTGSIGELGSTWVLPPTLLAQYHFPTGTAFRPYVGAGLNVTLFYAEDASDGLEAAVGSTDIDLETSAGIALQAGFDYALSDKMFFNMDVKWIDMDTDATITTTAIGVQEVDVSIDPLVIGVGIGWKL